MVQRGKNGLGPTKSTRGYPKILQGSQKWVKKGGTPILGTVLDFWVKTACNPESKPAEKTVHHPSGVLAEVLLRVNFALPARAVAVSQRWGGSLGGKSSDPGGGVIPPPQHFLQEFLKEKSPKIFFHAGGLAFGYKIRILKSWGVYPPPSGPQRQPWKQPKWALEGPKDLSRPRKDREGSERVPEGLPN